MATPVLLRELAVSPKLWQALCDRGEENNRFAIAKEFFDQRDVTGAPSLAHASVNTHTSTSFHSTSGRDTNGTQDDSQLDTQIEPLLKKQDLPVLGFALQAARRSCRDRNTAFSFDEVTAEPLGIMLFQRFLCLMNADHLLSALCKASDWMAFNNGLKMPSSNPSDPVKANRDSRQFQHGKRTVTLQTAMERLMDVNGACSPLDDSDFALALAGYAVVRCFDGKLRLDDESSKGSTCACTRRACCSSGSATLSAANSSVFADSFTSKNSSQGTSSQNIEAVIPEMCSLAFLEKADYLVRTVRSWDEVSPSNQANKSSTPAGTGSGSSAPIYHRRSGSVPIPRTSQTPTTLDASFTKRKARSTPTRTIRDEFDANRWKFLWPALTGANSPSSTLQSRQTDTYPSLTRQCAFCGRDRPAVEWSGMEDSGLGLHNPSKDSIRPRRASEGGNISANAHPPVWSSMTIADSCQSGGVSHVPSCVVNQSCPPQASPSVSPTPSPTQLVPTRDQGSLPKHLRTSTAGSNDGFPSRSLNRSRVPPLIPLAMEPVPVPPATLSPLSLKSPTKQGPSKASPEANSPFHSPIPANSPPNHPAMITPSTSAVSRARTPRSSLRSQARRRASMSDVSPACPHEALLPDRTRSGRASTATVDMTTLPSQYPSQCPAETTALRPSQRPALTSSAGLTVELDGQGGATGTGGPYGQYGPHPFGTTEPSEVCVSATGYSVPDVRFSFAPTSSPDSELIGANSMHRPRGIANRPSLKMSHSRGARASHPAALSPSMSRTAGQSKSASSHEDRVRAIVLGAARARLHTLDSTFDGADGASHVWQRRRSALKRWSKSDRHVNGLPYPAPDSLTTASRAPAPMSLAVFMQSTAGEMPHEELESRAAVPRRLVDAVESELEQHIWARLGLGPARNGQVNASPHMQRLRDAMEGLARRCLEALRLVWWPLFVRSAYFGVYLRVRMSSRRFLAVDDFVAERRLGRGAFGAVFACRKQDSGRMYAVKRMNKAAMVRMRAETVCRAERKVLSRLDNRFIVPLYYALQTDHHLYLVMKCMNGGDISARLRTIGGFTVNEMRFYAAQLVLALEHIHEQGYIYRDLKPDNVLLDSAGNARLTDMGLVTAGPVARGKCGTRGYWAPEMLSTHRGDRPTYTASVDWWSLGCLLYEMVQGKCPFRTKAAKKFLPDADEQTSMDAATLQMTVTFNRQYFTVQAAEFVNHLLQRNPPQRLGHQGAAQIKAHPFFAGLDWQMLKLGMLPPPPLPPLPEGGDENRRLKRDGDSEWEIKTTDPPEGHIGTWPYVNCIAGQVDACEMLQSIATSAAQKLPPGHDNHRCVRSLAVPAALSEVCSLVTSNCDSDTGKQHSAVVWKARESGVVSSAWEDNSATSARGRGDLARRFDVDTAVDITAKTRTQAHGGGKPSREMGDAAPVQRVDLRDHSGFDVVRARGGGGAVGVESRGVRGLCFPFRFWRRRRSPPNSKRVSAHQVAL